ncbi:MAG: T9SS type A sorting domain-containing protein [Prolixibacteraceae bacterium]
MKNFTLLMVFMTVLLTINLHAQNRNSILFITNEELVDSEGNAYLDQPIIDELSMDYDVTVAYAPFDYVDMNNYGMVFIGRAVNSGDFTDFQAWSDVEVPVLICSVWLMRNNRLMFFNGTDAKKVIDDGSVYDGFITTAAVLDETDPAFEGVELNDGTLDWYNGFYDYYAISYEMFSDVNNGTPLAYISNDDITPTSAGNVVMARWESGVETYEGSGNLPAAWRSFVQFGADDNQAAEVRLYNYSNFTDASLHVILNEVKYLLSESINYIKTGIDKTTINKQISVYQSANKNEFVVDLSLYEANAPLLVRVVNNNGQVVDQQIISGDATKTKWNAHLNSGIYIVNVSNQNVNHSSRILIK